MAKRGRAATRSAEAPKLTRRQVARFERERRQRQILFGSVGGALLLIIGLIGFGVVREQILLPRETVLTVNDTNFSRETYWKVRRLELGRQLQQLQFQTQFGGQNAQFIRQRMEALQQDLKAYRTAPLDAPTLEKMANNELMRQRAVSLGVTVSDEDLQLKAEEEFAPPPSTPTPVTTAEASQTAAAATAIATLTPPPPTLAPTQAPVTGSPVPTVTPTTGPTMTSTAFVTPTITATATAMSNQARATANTTFRDQIGALRQVYGISIDDYRELVIRPQLLEERIKEKLGEQAPAVQPQVRAAHILVANEEAAKQVREELDKGGDFAALARQRSTDPSNKDKGGDLDWFPRGIMAAEFEKAAFELPVNTISQPVKTQFGWHVIQILDKSETRPVTPALLNQVRETAFDTWIKAQRANSAVTASIPLPTFSPSPTPAPGETPVVIGTPRG